MDNILNAFKDRMARYAAAQLREPSTWRGITYLLTSAGVALSPEQTAAIVSAGLALSGAIGVFVPDSTD